MHAEHPYLSIVVAGRNDNYGGDFLQRLQRFISRLSYLIEKYHLATELVLVNYNPIENEAGLDELISWPTQRKWLQVKFLTVPKSVHETLIDPNVRKTVPLFEFIAKNAGIRRAQGQFILATNADILFSEGLIKKLSDKLLQPGHLYRADRLDFQGGGTVLDVEVPNFAQSIESAVFGFFLQGKIYHLSWPVSLSRRLQLLRLYNKLRQKVYAGLRYFLPTRQLLYFFVMPKDEAFVLDYHCNACGDFALMDQQSWHRLKGFAEDTRISTHTDSLQVMSAVASGLPIKVLPFPVFHQEHVRRFDFSKENPDMAYMYKYLVQQVQSMLESNQPYPTKEDWGLVYHELPEITL